MFAFRPGFERGCPRTPVDGLYLAGPSSAAGPLATGSAGAIAAAALIADLRAGQARMSEEFDALVVGGGVEGLIAVSLLAKAGLRAQMLERSAILYGHAGAATLNALDPLVVKELRLARHGLKFASRDLGLTALRQGGANAVIGRDRHATARSLAALSQTDALAYAGFRRELFALARALRPSWWDGRPVAEILAVLKPRQRALFARLSVTSACAFVAAAFESDAPARGTRLRRRRLRRRAAGSRLGARAALGPRRRR
ncbi:MAG: FAD-dependent monooxygenase [Rhizomicrobium sp.]